MFFTSPLRITGLGLGLLLGAAACTGGGTHGGAIGGAPAISANSHALRLEQILAGELGDAAADQYELDLAGHQESLTAACMTSHGHRYLPRNPTDIVDTVTNTDFASLTYAEQYGFGVTALPVFSHADPNQNYLNSLTATARAAYQQQLDHCSQHAIEQANDDYGVTQANRDFNRTDAAVQTDPRYRTAMARWSQCAAAAGYRQPSRADLIDTLQTRLDTIRQRIDTSGATTDEQVARRTSHDPEFRALRHDEITAAVATFPCSQHLDNTYRRIYTELRPATAGSQQGAGNRSGQH